MKSTIYGVLLSLNLPDLGIDIEGKRSKFNDQLELLDWEKIEELDTVWIKSYDIDISKISKDVISNVKSAKEKSECPSCNFIFTISENDIEVHEI